MRELLLLVAQKLVQMDLGLQQGQESLQERVRKRFRGVLKGKGGVVKATRGYCWCYVLLCLGPIG